MGIDRHAVGQAVDLAPDDIGRLAGHTRQGQQVVHRRRDFAAVVGQQPSRRLADVARLLPEETRWPDEFFKFDGVGRGQRFGRRVAGEERRRGQVDPLVGALGGQDRGDKQLQRRLVVEGAVGVGVGRAQAAEQLSHEGVADRNGQRRVVHAIYTSTRPDNLLSMR